MMYTKKCACGTAFYTTKRRRIHCKTCRRLHGFLAAKERRAMLLAAGGTHTHSQWLAVIRAQDNRCFWCHIPLTEIEKDHLVPISRGGSNRIANIAAVCPPCNREKGDRTPGEYRIFLTEKAREISETSTPPTSSEALFWPEPTPELRQLVANLAKLKAMSAACLTFKGMQVTR